MNVALYVRISTDQQTEENQVRILTEWAAARSWTFTMADIFRDTGSAYQHGDQRALKELLQQCDRGKYKQVIVYDLSRLTRKGPLELMLLLKQFADKGAPVYSYLDPAINVPGEFQPVLVAFYGVMANIFSTQLSARTKAGMARARAQGKHIGRPRKNDAAVNNTR
jgi:putative DNA-invertase from lambdoid prophage Rac